MLSLKLIFKSLTISVNFNKDSSVLFNASFIVFIISVFSSSLSDELLLFIIVVGFEMVGESVIGIEVYEIGDVVSGIFEGVFIIVVVFELDLFFFKKFY